MTGRILDYKQIDPESIVFETPKKVKGGSYMTEIKYRNSDGENVPFIIQTPRLISSEGIVRNDTRAHCELEFDKNHWPFYEFITNIDDHNIVVIEKYSEQWFTNKFPIDVVEEFYKTPVKLGRGKNPPKLKVKIPINRGELTCNIFDNVKNPINYTEVKKNNKVVCVLHLQGLRFLKQQVICEWIPLQIKVCKESVNQKMDYMINDTLLSDYEDNDMDQVQVQEEPVGANIPDPIQEEPVATEVPVQKEPVQKEPVQEEPVQEEPVQREPVATEVPVQGEENNLSELENGLLEQEIETGQETIKELIPDLELDTDDLEAIDLSNIQETNTESTESEVNSLESEIAELNSQLSEKNRLIDQMKTLLNN